MKKYYVIVVILSVIAVVFASTMRVNLNDGSYQEFQLDQILSITFGDLFNLILSEDWESGIIDEDVWDIVQICNDTPALSSDYSHSGDYSLIMIDHEGYNNPIIQNLNQFNLTQGFIEFYFMENHIHSSGVSRIHLKNIPDDYESCDLNNILCSIFVNPDSTMYLVDVENDPIALSVINLDQWYKIGISFDINENTLSIYVDGQMQYSGIYNPEFTDTVKYLQFSAYSYWSNGPEYYIDDINIWTD